jgi:hypothetical protein
MSATLQPALIIGLGGSGIEIVRRFKHRLERDYEDQSHVRFLGIDTDVQREPRDGVPKLKDGEFIHASNFSPEQYVSPNALNNYPEIREWWRGYDRIALGMISTGAGQRRPVGRLALFVHFAQIRQAMARQIGEIFKTESFHRLPPEYRKQVTIYVVASTCGGTGTGMFLDLAYLAPVIVKEVQPQADSKVRGLLLLPSVFTGTNTVPQPSHTAMRANAFGALTELDWCMNPQGKRSAVKFPGMPMPVDRSTPPFKSCFLLGNQDEQGAVYTDIGELLERAATHLHITLASSLSTQGRSDLDNIEANVFQDAIVQGRARLYSSMNAGELVLPRRRVYSMWARDFALLVAERLDGGVSAQGGVVQKALDELERQPAMSTLLRFARPETLLERMNGVEETLGRLVSVDAAAIDHNSIASDAMYAQSEFTSHLSRLKVGDEIGEAVQELRGEVDALLGAVLGVGSLGDALAFVTEVRSCLDKLEQQVASARGNGPIEDWANDFAQSVTGSKKGLLEGADTYAKRLGQRGAEAGEAARRSWRRQVASRVQGILGEAAHLPTLRSFIEQRRSLLERLRVNVPGAAARLRTLRLPMVDGVLGATLSDGEIRHAFLAEERQERMEVASRPRLAQLLREPTDDSEELTLQLIEIAGAAIVEPMEEFIRGIRFDPADIATRLSQLQPLVTFTSDFASRLRGGSISHPPQPARLLGVPEGIVPEFQEARGSFSGSEREYGQPVAIRDQDRILMISQTHGFPLFAVAELAICRQAIDVDSLGRILRFTLPDADARSWQIFPALASEANKWFAVAIAVGAVTRDLDAITYLQPGDDRAMPLVLFEGDGDAEVARRSARDAFNMQGLATGFQQGLKSVARTRGGNSGLVAMLDEWIERERGKAVNPRYPAEFRKDVEEVARFADSLREEF